MFRMLSKFGVNVLWPHRVVRPAVSWGHRSPNTKVKQALSRVHSPHRRFCCKLRVRKSFFDHTHGLQMIARCFPPKPASLWPRVLRNWVEGFRTTSWYKGNLEESPARFGQERAQLVHLAVFLALDHGAMGVEAWADRCKGKTWCQCSIPPATPRTSHLGLLHLIFHHPNRFKTLLDSILHILASYVTYMVPRQKGTVGTPWRSFRNCQGR